MTDIEYQDQMLAELLAYSAFHGRASGLVRLIEIGTLKNTDDTIKHLRASIDELEDNLKQIRENK